MACSFPLTVQGRPIFFAIDNVDFSEDTYDGKSTLQRTSMAIFKKCLASDAIPEIRLEDGQREVTGNRTVKDLPASISHLLDCPEPPPKPPCRAFSAFPTYEKDDMTVNSEDCAWLLARTFSRQQNSTDDSSENSIPVWSAYNSLVTKSMPVTRVGAHPLLAAPAQEWPTLLTVLKQAQSINVQVVGQHRKTVISLDLGLYLPAKRLQMSRGDLKNIILRPGELHIVMAQLKTIGAYIENSGIDLAWTESDLYGPSTVKQILEGNHIKRGQTAHIVTVQSLFMLYQDAFFSTEGSTCKESLVKLVQVLEDACMYGTTNVIEKAHGILVEFIESTGVKGKMAKFDKKQEEYPVFKVFRQYMTKVLQMMMFIRAVRSADWDLHLQALTLFCKYFFAHDRINYARMVPLYLAEMKCLDSTDPDIHADFVQGSWVVNKNAKVPFCSLGADRGLEHINRSIKVTGGLVGITQNQNARAIFFLIAPEMARLAKQARGMAGLTEKITEKHHDLSTPVLVREEKNVNALYTTIKSFTNPFIQTGKELFNLVTKVVVSETVVSDLCSQSDVGEKLMSTFVAERIKATKVNLWERMKKRKLLTWKSTGKKTKLLVNNKLVELQEDRELFDRMMMVCNTRSEINVKEAVGLYEFSVVPRALFAADGSMLHCHKKSALLELLEKEAQPPVNDDGPAREVLMRHKVHIVDGMAVLQSLEKPPEIESCSQLAGHFIDRLLQQHPDCEEMHLVFDRYDVPRSLKSDTRVRRQAKEDPIAYKITETTKIKKVPMKRLLSHHNTKLVLTFFLATKVLQRFRVVNRNIVVAWGVECEATHRDVTQMKSTQEEADTKMILHAMDAASHGATEINIFLPDTDVLVLALSRCPEMDCDLNFVTGSGQRRRVIKLQPIARALGNTRTAALPSFHALSGAGITGSFANKGKITWWNAFKEASREITTALVNFGSECPPNESTMAILESFVCQLYVPNTTTDNVADLRWWLFCKKQAQSERLPPTRVSFRQAFLRASYQALVWNLATVPEPNLPTPADCGWELKNDEWVPVMTTLKPAPDAIIELVQCGCGTSRCSTNSCSCLKAELSCTDLCGCSDSDTCCENLPQDDFGDVAYESDEDDS